MQDAVDIRKEISGVPLDVAQTLIVWGHGWGQDRRAFKAFSDALAPRAAHVRLDFPGFGESPMPPKTWGTPEYADAVAELIRPYRSIKKIIWVGHSFGGRIGIQLAARHPDLVDALFLVAGAGLRRNRSFYQEARIFFRIRTYKLLKLFVPVLGLNLDNLRQKFGSPDYRNAGEKRDIFLRTIAEDLTEEAKKIKCPVCLVYGYKDAETPPEIGVRLNKLIPQSSLLILPDQDHYSVIGEGRHIVLKHLAAFMEKLK